MPELPLTGPEVGTVLIAHPGAELYGSDRVMLETVTGLVERRWRVIVAMPNDGPLVAAARSLGAETVLIAAPVIRKRLLHPQHLASFMAGSVSASRRIDTLLKRVRPDVVYVSTVTVPLWILRARRRRIPVLCHVHESERAMPVMLREALAWPLLLADRVITNSRFSMDSLTEVVPSLARRTSVIYNGVAGPDAVRLPRPEVGGGLRIAYVGRLSPRKGVDVAISALGVLTAHGVPASLDIVGGVFPGYEWYEQQLHTQVATLGLGERVRFHGFRASIWHTLNEADVAVVPSRTEEPFGNTAVEAVLAGRPVIVSAIGGLGEAIDGFASAVSVDADDEHALAEALHRVAVNWSAFRRSAVALAPMAARRYAPETYREAISAEIRHLLARANDGSMALAS